MTNFFCFSSCFSHAGMSMRVDVKCVCMWCLYECRGDMMWYGGDRVGLVG